MTELVKLATARELVNAGAVQRAEVIGLPGGWAVQLQTYNQARVLATKRAEPRRFTTFEAALQVLRDLGMPIDALRVDAAHWERVGLLGARKRPDRSVAMKLKDRDARYAAYLRQSVEEAERDPRPALSQAEAKAYMAKLKADSLAAPAR